jgi:hypothetical protein
MKKLLFLVLLLACINTKAQDLTKYLPENPIVYNRFDLAKILKSQPLDTLKKKEFFQKFLKETLFRPSRDQDSLLTTIINNIEKFGLSLNNNAHLVVDEDDSLLQSNFIFQINNSAALEKNITELFPIGSEKVYYSSGNDFKLFIYKDMHMAWNNEIFVVGARFPLYEDTRNSWDLTDEERKEQKKLLNERDAKSIHKIFHANPLIQKKKYLKGLYKNADLALYMDLSGLYDLYVKFFSSRFSKFGVTESLLLTGNNALPYMNSQIYAGVFFNKDELLIKAKSKMGKELRKKLLKAYNRKYNSSIFNYVSNNAVLSTGMRINTEAYINFTFDVLSDFFKKTPNYGKYGARIITLIQTFLDEKGVGELVRGDVLFNLNGVSKKTVTYTTYTYDEEYNSTEVIKTKDINVPSFSIIGSTGNPKQLEKLLDLGLDLSKKYTKDKSVYTLKDRDFKELGGAIYVQITDHLFFISNDSTFMYTVVPNKGYGQNEKMNAKMKQHHKGKNMYMDFDAGKLLHSYADSTGEIRMLKKMPLLEAAAGKLNFEQRFSWTGVSTTLTYKTSNKSSMLPLLSECLNQYYVKQRRYSYNDEEYDYSAMAADSVAIDSLMYLGDSTAMPAEYYYDENGNAIPMEVIAPSEDAPIEKKVVEQKKAPATKPKNTSVKKQVATKTTTQKTTAKKPVAKKPASKK